MLSRYVNSIRLIHSAASSPFRFAARQHRGLVVNVCKKFAREIVMCRGISFMSSKSRVKMKSRSDLAVY